MKLVLLNTVSYFTRMSAVRQIQVTQLQEKLNDIQKQIENLQIVSPYSGTVRNIEFLGQSEDGAIAVKILLLVKDN